MFPRRWTAVSCCSCPRSRRPVSLGARIGAGSCTPISRCFAACRVSPASRDATGQGRGPAKRAVLKASLSADRCYIVDRGYEGFSLYNAIVAGAQQLRRSRPQRPSLSRPRRRGRFSAEGLRGRRFWKMPSDRWARRSPSESSIPIISSGRIVVRVAKPS